MRAPLIRDVSVARGLTAWIGASLLAANASASDLTLDGVTELDLPYGNAVLVEVTGGPDLPFVLYGDVGPGPTLVAGELVPLALSPALVPLLAGSTGPSGSFALAYPTPQNPALAGSHVYLAAAVWDAGDPNGFDVSNGAVVHLVPPVGAGADQSAMVGARVTLDGSALTQADGTLAANTTVFWELIERPGASLALLEGADTLYPTLLPDEPGDYRFRVTASAGGSSQSAETTVHAFALELVPPIEGRYFPGGSATFSGELRGPAGAGLTLDGAPVALDASGFFGPVTVDFTAGLPSEGVLFGIDAPGGSAIAERRTVMVASPQWIDFGAASSAVAHLEASGLAQVAEGVETSLEGTDLSGFLVDLPPTLIAKEEGWFGFVIFSATIDFTNMTWNPDMQVAMVPTATGVDVNVHLTNVTTYFDVWGDLLEIPYNVNGDSTSSGVDISAKLQLYTSAGQLKVNVLNTDVQLSGFQFDLHGFLGDAAELFIVESWVKDKTIETMENELGAQIGPAVEELLSAFQFQLDLEPEFEVPATVATSFSGVQHSSHGVSLTLDTQIAAAPVPGAPNVASYPATPGAVPAFGTQTPSGQGYGGALAASDDFLNLILAGLTRAGLLEGDLAELFPADPGQPASVLTTEVMEVLFPGAGFGNFPAGTVVSMLAAGSVPPVIVPSPGGPAMAELHLAGLEVELSVTWQGAPTPILRLVLDGYADVDMQPAGDGTLAAVLVGSSFTPTVLQGFPGSTIPSLQTGSEFLVQILLPQLTEALGTIPIPSLDQEGVTLTTDEVGLMGSPPEFLGFWGGMTYAPPPL